MNRSIKMVLTGLGATLFLASGAFSAGGGHEEGTKSGMAHNMAPMHEEMEAKLGDTAAFGAKGRSAEVSRTVNIEASEIRFNVEQLEFKVDETVRFVITNKGEQTHELSIGDTEYHQIARQMMAHMTEMGMDPAAPEHAAIHASAGNTVVVRVGETKEIVWTFSRPGTFEFSCNMVGHSEVGMKGTITVG